MIYKNMIGNNNGMNSAEPLPQQMWRINRTKSRVICTKFTSFEIAINRATFCKHYAYCVLFKLTSRISIHDAVGKHENMGIIFSLKALPKTPKITSQLHLSSFKVTTSALRLSNSYIHSHNK